MRKTSDEVEAYIFSLIKADEIAELIGGNIYKNGLRPINSKNEDIVTNFLTGIDGQKQTGVININVYVPDIDNGSGSLVKNIQRCIQISTALLNFKESLMISRINLSRSGYYFLDNDSMIQSFAEEGIHQHFVNLRLKFEYLTI